MTMLENLKEAREPGSAPNHCFHRTFAVLAVQLCGSQTASSFDCSFNKDYSAFAYLLRDPMLAVEETGRTLRSPP